MAASLLFAVPILADKSRSCTAKPTDHGEQRGSEPPHTPLKTQDPSVLEQMGGSDSPNSCSIQLNDSPILCRNLTVCVSRIVS